MGHDRNPSDCGNRRTSPWTQLGGIAVPAQSERTGTMDWQALLLTLKLDLVVCGLLVLIGVPLAFWLAFCRWRWKFLIEAILALPSMKR